MSDFVGSRYDKQEDFQVLLSKKDPGEPPQHKHYLWMAHWTKASSSAEPRNNNVSNPLEDINKGTTAKDSQTLPYEFMKSTVAERLMVGVSRGSASMQHARQFNSSMWGMARHVSNELGPKNSEQVDESFEKSMKKDAVNLRARAVVSETYSIHKLSELPLDFQNLGSSDDPSPDWSHFPMFEINRKIDSILNRKRRSAALGPAPLNLNVSASHVMALSSQEYMMHSHQIADENMDTCKPAEGFASRIDDPAGLNSDPSGPKLKGQLSDTMSCSCSKDDNNSADCPIDEQHTSHYFANSKHELPSVSNEKKFKFAGNNHNRIVASEAHNLKTRRSVVHKQQSAAEAMFCAPVLGSEFQNEPIAISTIGKKDGENFHEMYKSHGKAVSCSLLPYEHHRHLKTQRTESAGNLKVCTLPDQTANKLTEKSNGELLTYGPKSKEMYTGSCNRRRPYLFEKLTVPSKSQSAYPKNSVSSGKSSGFGVCMYGTNIGSRLFGAQNQSSAKTETLHSDTLIGSKSSAGIASLPAQKDDVLHTLQKDLQEKMNKMRIVDSLNFIPATNQQQHLQTNHLTVDSSKKIPADVQLHNQGNLNVVDPHNFVTAAEQLNMLNQITIANSQNFVPAVEKSSSTSSVSANVIKAPQDNQSAGVLPLSEKMDSTKAGIPGPEAVIVVNTGNHGKNMLFSRRSSYQQILALERGGMQVVERDVDLPVDLILTTAVCLLWYDTRTSGSSELTISSDTSGITNFVEDIATNILMALSFCFCGCIMVFEGENHLLSAVLEASDSLYASAASLDMNLQLFFSQTPKSTDQIILNCIQNAVRINQAPCPQIPESESLVESFVTAFPSVSPLSAHMILSSGTLLDFLRWSHEQRTQAVEKYRLPPQSISLFSALCKFGELGESKSVMTECSSVDSDISSALLQSARKKKRCATQDFSAAVSHPARPNPCTQLHGDCVENDKVFSPPKLRKFSHIDDMMPDLPEVFMIDQRLNMGSEGVSCQPKKYDVDAVTGIHIIDDYFINELTPNFKTYNERASSMVDTCNFSRQSKLRAKQPIRSSFRASMPSACITSSHPAFPSALEISNDPGNWDVSCGINQSWTDNVHGDFATSSGRNDLGSRYHEPRQEIMQTPASSLPFLKQDFGCHGASQGSGWEMDYLRQMNENRKARQEQSRCNVSATWSNSRTRDGSSRILSVPPIESFRYQRNTDTPFRDQSPSDIESFRHRRNINTLLRDQSPSNEAHRYEKGRGGTKAQSHRVRKDFKAQPSINHGKSIVPSIEPTWTPLDKRARQKLTFATHGSEKQTKLVWRHKSSPGVGCGFPKRYQEEAP